MLRSPVGVEVHALERGEDPLGRVDQWSGAPSVQGDTVVLRGGVNVAAPRLDGPRRRVGLVELDGRHAEDLAVLDVDEHRAPGGAVRKALDVTHDLASSVLDGLQDARGAVVSDLRTVRLSGFDHRVQAFRFGFVGHDTGGEEVATVAGHVGDQALDVVVDVRGCTGDEQAPRHIAGEALEAAQVPLHLVHVRGVEQPDRASARDVRLPDRLQTSVVAALREQPHHETFVGQPLITAFSVGQ